MQNSVGRTIGRLSNQIRRRLDACSTHNGMSGSQGRILHFILAQTEDIFQKDIEEEFNLRPSTATGILKLMERDGIIRRESVEYDARLKRILVTDKVAEIKEQVIQDVQGIDLALVQGISKEELSVFFKVTQQMSKNLGK